MLVVVGVVISVIVDIIFALTITDLIKELKFKKSFSSITVLVMREVGRNPKHVMRYRLAATRQRARPNIYGSVSKISSHANIF